MLGCYRLPPLKESRPGIRRGWEQNASVGKVSDSGGRWRNAAADTGTTRPAENDSADGGG